MLLQPKIGNFFKPFRLGLEIKSKFLTYFSVTDRKGVSKDVTDMFQWQNVTWSDWVAMAVNKIDGAMDKYDLLINIIPKEGGNFARFLNSSTVITLSRRVLYRGETSKGQKGHLSLAPDITGRK